MFLAIDIWFFGSLVIVVACYRAMQRVTVNHDCVFVNASLYLIVGAQSFFFPFVYSRASTVF